MKCPTCKQEMTAKEDRLPQCGYTFLPTTSHECQVCDFKVYEGAKPGTPYQAEIPKLRLGNK